MSVNKIAEVIEKLDSRLSWDEYFISLALLIASRSTCGKLHVGCILVKNTRVISSGYNGFLAKLPHESCIRDNHEIATVHAEQNAIADCARRGVEIEGATAYITHYPCINCCKILLAAGIDEIKYHNDYHNDKLVEELLKKANVFITKL